MQQALNEPMLELRRSAERGYADHGWLKSVHTFSLADYVDPKPVEFGPLRAINEDRVEPGQGFGTHGYRDMEIVSYVLQGELAHNDSVGHASTLRPGNVQRMSASTGVRHSEFNGSATKPVHFLQIWIHPNQADLAPEYEEKAFLVADKRGRLRLIASPDRTEGSLLIHQDARVYAGLLDDAATATLNVRPGHRAYVHVARGAISVNDTPLQIGAGLKLEGATALKLNKGQAAEVLVFDLP